jgi:hypothetical protein
VLEIIDPVFAKTSQNARFLLSENERFGLVFVKTGSINSGTGNTGRERGDGEGGGGSKIIRRRESMVLYKSFNILCTNQSAKSNSQDG